MRKILKYTICALALSSALVFSSCEDMLDRRPLGRPESITPQDLIFKAYRLQRLSGVTGGIPAFAVHSFRSEDAEKGSTLSDGADHGRFFDNFEYDTTNGILNDYWQANYQLIHTANDVLTLINEQETMTPDLFQVKGEALFLRAYAYFNLVRAFGEVPKIDFSLVVASDANIPKSSVTVIYELIDADLTEAERTLPQVWEKKFLGRITWGAARSLHARTYMMRGDWANMYTAANDVIGSNLYNLDTAYDKIFREPAENGSESVFEIQAAATTADASSTAYGSEFAMVQGVRGSGEWNLGWGWNTPTDLMASAFEINDPRKDETLLYFAKSQAEADGMTPNRPWGEIPIANDDVIAKYFNKKAYTDPALRAQLSRQGFWYNTRIIRYSDVVLMAAEAANELGNSATALANLEKVRARARGGNSAVLPKVTTTDKVELRKAIQHERRVELGMEFDRFYDLVRWGIAKEVLHAAGKTNYEDKHALLPIPQIQIDRSNGVLVQNPKY